MKTKLTVLFAALVLLTSCTFSGSTLPSVSGTKYEILVVMDDANWKAPSGRALAALLRQDMTGLPQPEPVMDVSQCSRTEFTDVLKPARNLLITEISDKYTVPKIIYTQDKFAHPQTVVRITAPNDSVFEATIKTFGDRILDYFLRSERDRQLKYNKEYINDKAKAQVEKMFGVSIDIPLGITRITKRPDFFWITNGQPNVRQDIVIYSYPYTDKKTFTKEFLLAKRDSVMKANIPGELKGSYMGTENEYDKPVFKEIWVNNGYCAEVRGLWKMMNGASMGGPFYSHTRLDEINQRVITIEGFVFAPGTKKRNHIRQLEAAIYSAKLPQEINVLKEVSVVANKETKK
ncbi:MAG: DUF4837 family protein [Paludibacter sp.]|nr:DUF4837 family protein [Paludibacter sp.]